MSDHQPEKKAKLFISYKTLPSQITANNLKARLETDGFSVWMDTSDLMGGERWDKQIYDEIGSSDMVLLLLAKTTPESIWVRREVDVARGAQVYILPLITEPMDQELGAVLDHFGLTNLQAVKYTAQDADQYRKLIEQIAANKTRTRLEQQTWLSKLLEGDAKPLTKEAVRPFKPRYQSYMLADGSHPACRVHLAGGDMTDARKIDVLVNSENNYMQMARIFESSTLSSKLRLHGSQRDAGGQLVDDTVQQELYQQIKQPSGNYRIPIAWGYVVPTHAGHPDSRLARNEIRYIFHTVAVTVDYEAGGEAIKPIPDGRIKDAICNCLEETMQIDKLKGVISPSGTETYKQENQNLAAYKPIQSIMFPLFATGHGKRQNDIAQISHLMVEGICEFLSQNADNPQFLLKNIHLCAYSLSDLEIVEAELKKMSHLLINVPS